MRAKKGFTLVELLVVIGIIALLIAVLLPSLGMARRQARNVACLSNLHQLALAYTQYTTNNRNKSFCYTDAIVNGVTLDPDYVMWQEQLRPYYGHRFPPTQLEDTKRGVRFCPEATDLMVPVDLTAGSPFLSDAGHWGDAFHAWDFPEATANNRPIFSSYGVNGWIYEPAATDPSNPLWPAVTEMIFGWAQCPATGDANATLQEFYLHQVSPTDARAAEVPIMGDCVRVDGWPQTADPGPGATQENYKPATGYQADLITSHMSRFAMVRHEKICNLAFLDGHAESMRLKNPWNLRWQRDWVPPTNPPVFPAGF